MKTSIKQAIVAMDLGKSDQSMLKWLQLLGAIVPIDKASFIHVVPAIDLYGANNLNDFILMSKNITRKMKNTIKGKIISKASDRDEITVTEGNPLDELVTIIEEKNADLVVTGKSTEETSHGILLKNLLRRITCNTLIVPDKSKSKLSHVLVPFDFSENSIKALRRALDIKRQVNVELKLTVVNVYELPSIQTYKIGKTETQLNNFLIKDRKEAFENFITTYFPNEDSTSLDIDVVQLENTGIAEALIKYAREHKVDLIIQGAKGHSKIGLLLLGSVTEKVISLTRKVSILIIK